MLDRRSGCPLQSQGGVLSDDGLDLDDDDELETHVASGRVQRGRDASPLVHAYQTLIEQSDAMATSFEANSERRRLHQAALQLGIEQLSAERVKQQQRAIRFNTLKNEVDIFQQYLDPFIFEMRTPHEHQVNSSVYRHFTRMQGIQELGIPIYSLGNYLEDEYDHIRTARTTQKFYRRIRRHDAAHYIDTELIPRPVAPSRRKSTILTASSPEPAHKAPVVTPAP